MRTTSRAALLLLALLLQVAPKAPAQQSQDSSVIPLREQISKLERLDGDPSLPAEILDVNRSLLGKRRAQLHNLLSKRRNALQRYLATLGPGARERPAVEQSIGRLQTEMASLERHLRLNPAADNSARVAPNAFSSIVVSTVMTQKGVGKATGFSPPPAYTPFYEPAHLALKPKSESVKPNAAPEPLPPVQDITIRACTEKKTGERRRGPATVTVDCVNPVRYDNQLQEEASFPPLENLNLPFIPPIPQATPKPTPAPAKSLTQTETADKAFGSSNLSAEQEAELRRIQREADQLTLAFNSILGDLESIEGALAGLQSGVAKAVDTVNAATSQTTSLVQTSDAVLNSSGPTGLVAAIRPVVRAIDNALGSSGTWPVANTNALEGDINNLRNKLETLPSVHSQGWAVWYDGGNKLSYDHVRTRLGELLTAARGLNRDSQQFRDYETARTNLRSWRNILGGINYDPDRPYLPNSFRLSSRESCSFAFGEKKTPFKHFRRERLATTPREETLSEVTVICSSPLSVSAGFGFSFLDERDFAFVQSATSATDPTIIQRFGFTSRSRFRPIPAILLNTRIYEFDDTFAAHFSTGAVVDVKTGQGGAGTDLEFIAGPSLSIRRILFITPGLHIGRVPELTGGFNVGDRVPMGVASPPLEKSWKSGFMTTFTFNFRP